METSKKKLLLEYPVNYATCRALTGRRWEVINVVVPEEWGTIEYHFACNQCTMYKMVSYNKRTGRVVYTRYTQPNDYRLKDAPSRDEIRAALFQR